MADENSVIKLFKCEDRLRLKTAHAEDFVDLAREIIENLAWGAISDYNFTAYGWKATFSASRSFSVAVGAGYLDGDLAKTTSAQLVTLDENTDPSNPRIDLVEINALTNTASDAANEVILGAISRTAVSGEAVGTGDSSQKAWDLDYAGVDGRTLKVYLGGTQVGGWNLSPGTGAGSKDQIIFHEAPGAVAITADYTYQTGGAESVSSVNTRYSRAPTFSVVKGTPGGGAPSWTSGSIRIAQISVPASWTGGASGVTITNSVKEFVVNTDQGNDPDGYSPAISPYAGKLIYPVRGIDQIVQGCRLRWTSSNSLEITPGWGVIQGVSFSLTSPLSVTVADPPVSAMGWWYVYLVVGATDTTKPGSAPTATISGTAPNSMRRKYGDARMIYIGSIYATAAATIRPFYTHGNNVVWEDPSAITLEYTSTTPVDKNVSVWVPPTGRLFNALLTLLYQENSGGAAGVEMEVVVHSHKNATSKDYPLLGGAIHVPVVNTQYDQTFQGWLRAEDDSGTRYVHFLHDYTGTPDDSTARLYVLGYVDDYRTMAEDGSVNFY